MTALKATSNSHYSLIYAVLRSSFNNVTYCTLRVKNINGKMLKKIRRKRKPGHAGFHSDYHTPEDEFEKVSYQKMSDIIRIGFLNIWILVNMGGFETKGLRELET
jgi:hypothetical protein